MDIRLRQWQAGDQAALAALCSGADRRFLSDRLPDPYTCEDAAQWLDLVAQREGKDGVFRAIAADGAIVGMISVERKEDVYRKDAEIGYFLLTQQWSRGIMTQAVGQICDVAFRTLDIVRITGLVYAPNIASRRVLEKNGFLLEGLMRSAVVKNGVLHDLCIYGKLR